MLDICSKSINETRKANWQYVPDILSKECDNEIFDSDMIQN